MPQNKKFMTTKDPNVKDKLLGDGYTLVASNYGVYVFLYEGQKVANFDMSKICFTDKLYI